MMRRIDLLPAAYAERRRQRRNLGLVAIAGLVLLILAFGWWFMLGTQISDARNELQAVQAENARLEAEIAELQRFAELEAEVQGKRAALQTVMAGDIDWPAVLTEIAMVIPPEVWLTQLSSSAGATEGAAPVGTETAPIRITRKTPFGRIQFSGSSLSMPGVAKWLLRLATVRDFDAVYLSNATATEGETGPTVIDFQSTLELSDKALSGRFQGRLAP